MVVSIGLQGLWLLLDSLQKLYTAHSVGSLGIF